MKLVFLYAIGVYKAPVFRGGIINIILVANSV